LSHKKCFVVVIIVVMIIVTCEVVELEWVSILINCRH